MKTENLNFIEAVAALGRGECVQDSEGDRYRWCDRTEDILIWSPSGGTWVIGGIDADYAPFSIVPDPSKPEPKPLTFEEAVAALDAEKDVYINAPIPSLCHHLHGSVERDPVQELLLDLASRRNWKIELVEGE